MSGEARRAGGPRHRAIVALGAVLLVAGALRLPGLAGVPAPAGDEGVWADWALSLARGEPAAAPPGSGYASSAYAWILAASFRALGPTFLAARALNVAGALLAIAAVWAIARRAGGERAGLLAALLLAVHPLEVAWSRTAAVPYVPQAALGLVGAWLLVFSPAERRRAHAGGVLLLLLPLHFGPIHGATVLAVAVALAASGRWRRLAHPLAGGAVLVAAAAVAPVVLGGADLLAHGGQPPASDLPRYLLRVARGLGGSWTLAHFSPLAPPAAASAGAALGVVLIALPIGLAAGPARALARFASLQLGCTVVLVPALLALRGFDWSMPFIDHDRYLLPAAPWLALLAGCAAASSRARSIAVVAAIGVLSTASGAMLWSRAHAGGPDRGVGAESGGARAWSVAAGERPLVEVVAGRIRRFAGGRATNVVAADHAFRGPLRFLLHGERERERVLDREPGVPGPTCVLAYAAEVFAPGYAPARHVAENAAARAAAVRLRGARRAVFRDRAGVPLAELTCGEALPGQRKWH